MSRRRWLVALFLPILAVPVLGQPAAEPAWKFDKLRTKNGLAFQGILVAENETSVRFHDVRRNPARPTVVVARTFARSAIERIERLDARDRERLAERLKALDPTGKVEDTRIRGLELKAAEWQWGRERKGGLSYNGEEHFLLFSTARRDIVERAVLRLEEVYAAYTSFLPPRPLEKIVPMPTRTVTALHELFGALKPAPPRLFLRSRTTILLAQSRAEYHEMLKSTGLNILNPAYYDATRNEVVCASELEQLGDKLEEIRKEHERQSAWVKREEEKAKKLPAGEVRDRVLREIETARQEIIKVTAANEAQFREATHHLFQTLYHEAFHAYLASYVWPPTERTVPRWINEGLAQVFENAVVEAGVLHVDRPDANRLERVKRALKAEKPEEQLVRLADLLRSDAKQFLIEHAGDRRAAARHYLTSWALAYYLAFDRQLLGSRKLDEYIDALTREGDPQAAFVKLIGQELPQFEKEFHDYLAKLKG